MLPGLLIVLSALLVAAGATFFMAASVLPYEWVRLRLDRFAADGSADAYTRAVHLAIVARLRYVGVGAIALGIVVHAARRSFAAAIGRLWVASGDLSHDVGQRARRLWSEEPDYLLALAAIVSTGIGIRLWLLNWPIRHDEAYTYLTYVRHPLVLGLTKYDTPNNHLFHTLLAHVSYAIFGNEPWSVRLPAFSAGVLILPAAYVAIRALYGDAAALIGTAITTTSMAAIEISTNARGYSIVTLFFMLLVCLAAYLRETNNVAAWFLLGAFGALGLYTIPTMLYALAAVVAWLLLSVWVRDIRVPPRQFVIALTWSTLAAGVAAGILYAPILVRTDVHTVLASPIVSIKVRSLSWPAFVDGNTRMGVDAWRRWMSDLPLWCSAVWLAGVVAALAFHRRVSRTRVPLVAGVVLGCVPILLFQRVAPPSRAWVFLFPVVAGMGAAGVLYLLARCAPSRWANGREWRLLVVGSALALTVIGALSVGARSRHYTYNLSDFPGAERAVVFLAPQLRPGDKVVVLGLSLSPFLYYCDLHGLPYLTYVYDYLLEGWAPLRGANRIFVVVNERKHTLEDVLTESRLAGTGTPIEIAAFDASRVYLMTHQ
jgi:Dolichyl-phosphate-mannose-protein mannosyltransferase